MVEQEDSVDVLEGNGENEIEGDKVEERENLPDFERRKEADDSTALCELDR